MASYVAVDVESTGMNPRKDRIVAIAIALLDADLNVENTLMQRFEPGILIPAEAVARHGITNEAVKGLGMFKDVAQRVRALLLKRPVVGYNVNFDLSIIHHELQRAGLAGFPPNLPVVDPFRIFCNEHPRTLTAALQSYCGKPHPRAHDPLEDVLATVEVLKAQLATRNVKSPSVPGIQGTWSLPAPGNLQSGVMM
ncbi:MAG: 3'-5' exonuclease [Candidatus Thermoplasmatota archaeon]|jgi:DNA polymerase III epsilon subunit-like protein